MSEEPRNNARRKGRPAAVSEAEAWRIYGLVVSGEKTYAECAVEVPCSEHTIRNLVNRCKRALAESAKTG